MLASSHSSYSSASPQPAAAARSPQPVTERSPTAARWRSSFRLGSPGRLVVRHGSFEFDGTVQLGWELSPLAPARAARWFRERAATGEQLSARAIGTARLALAATWAAGATKLASGAALGADGGLRPPNASTLDWTWASTRLTIDSAFWKVWLGDSDAGLLLKLRGSSLEWDRVEGGWGPPLESWAGADRSGGMRFNGSAASDEVTVTAYAGEPPASAEPQVFNCTLLATPVKGRGFLHSREAKQQHYEQMRIYHAGFGTWEAPDAAALRRELGVTVVTLHQGSGLNRFINYPMHPRLSLSLAFSRVSAPTRWRHRTVPARRLERKR